MFGKYIFTHPNLSFEGTINHIMLQFLVNSFIYSNFNYCLLVWMFSHKKSLNKIESLHKRALRFLLNDYENSYEELLEKSGKCNMNLQRIRFLCIEIYKTINSLNPDFMKNIFELKTNNRIVRE